jgi:enediyne biosynthesis protein E4
LHNRGDGTFEDASSLLPADRLVGAGFVAAWTDLDEDGDLDLYVVNDFGMDVTNQYFRYDEGSFEAFDVPCGCGVAVDGMGMTVLDYDGDERLDLYLSNRHGEMLLRNLGGQTVDTTVKHGALGDSVDASRGTSWGTDTLDFDLDGWPDLVLAFGDEFGNEPARNRLFRNMQGRFEEVEDSGFTDLHDTRGVAVLDFDRDGCTDLALHGPAGFELYRGRCPDVPWIGLDLPPRSAGARVEVLAGRLQVHEVSVGGTSVHGSRDPSLRFGLGDAPLEDVAVHWPDGTTTHPDITLNAYNPL